MNHVNTNPYTTLILSKKALEWIYVNGKGFEDEDWIEIKAALRNCDDKITLEQNAVTTPLNMYK